jgi:hypothetical protein
MIVCHYQWRFKKKKENLSAPVGAAFFPLAPSNDRVTLSLKKIERRHSQWRIYTNASVTLARLHSTTGSSALSFVFLKFQFYYFYY